MFDGVDMDVLPFYIGHEAWPSFAERVSPHLARMAAGSGGRYEAEDIATAIREGQMQVWVALCETDILCVLVTQIVVYPRLRALRCIGIVGHRARRWMGLLSCVERAAKTTFRCDLMEALHQPGHERLLTTGDWHTYHLLSEKVL